MYATGFHSKCWTTNGNETDRSHARVWLDGFTQQGWCHLRAWSKQDCHSTSPSQSSIVSPKLSSVSDICFKFTWYLFVKTSPFIQSLPVAVSLTYHLFSLRAMLYGSLGVQIARAMLRTAGVIGLGWNSKGLLETRTGYTNRLEPLDSFFVLVMRNLLELFWGWTYMYVLSVFFVTAQHLSL